MSEHGRPLTSHERQAGRAWDASYRDGDAPWDLGRPQPAIARLASEGGLAGPLLDAGCGTGEHALLFASSGISVLGVDLAETAIGLAREKAAARSLEAEFVVGDALHLGSLGRSFAAVIDCGLFHTFDREERRAYVASLESVSGPGATAHILCFGDAEPEAVPHPVARHEIEAAFETGGWAPVSIRPDLIETTFAAEGLAAWLVTAERTGTAQIESSVIRWTSPVRAGANSSSQRRR